MAFVLIGDLVNHLCIRHFRWVIPCITAGFKRLSKVRKGLAELYSELFVGVVLYLCSCS